MIPSVPNLRDLGGLPTAGGRRIAPGRLFRSSHLSSLAEADRPRLQALGLRTVVDLRGVGERERAPPPLLARDVAQLHLPIEPRALGGAQHLEALGQLSEDAVDQLLRRAYRLMVGERLGAFRQFVVHLLEADRLPLLFHCTAGKDRTGFATAAVLWALEVPQPVIEQDFMLSNERWPRPTDGAGWVTLASVRLEYLHEAMQAIDEGWGSMAAWLERGLGLDDRARARLAEALLE